MTGLQTPRRMQGRDLISAVRHSGFRRKDFFYEHTFMGSPGIPKVEGVVSRKVKYMKFIEHGYEELYDLRKDPHETKNMADDPRAARLLQKTRGRASWRESVCQIVSISMVDVIIKKKKTT